MINELKLDSFHAIIMFQIDPLKFDELLHNVKDFLDNEVSRVDGFVSAKFHTNKERNILINYATWESKQHYEDYKAKTGTVSNRAKKVLAFNPTGHEVWHIAD